jgi:endosialidase-like protein
MNKSSESILALKPVIFHYKSDRTNMPQFGLIAEDVAKVNANLVVRDNDGDIYTVRYDAVNAMLLNEFLKEHRKVEAQQNKIEKQEAIITELKSVTVSQWRAMEILTAQVKTQAAQIRKVTAQVEMSSSTPKMVLNHR